MREILFRGRRIDDGKWVYGFYVLDCRRNQHMIFFNKVSGAINAGSEPRQDDYDLEICEVDPETVGQYTGLKDKNGVKIYEEDVVKGHYYINGNKKRIVGFVRFVRDGWHIEGLKQYKYVTTRLTPAFERLGNIHDNPELLEVE